MLACEIVAFGSIDPTPPDRIVTPVDGDDARMQGVIPSSMTFSARTNTIEARLGSGFGLAHRFSGSDGRDVVDVVLHHPPIDYGSGASTRTAWQKPATGQGTSFFFDVAPELVPGTWRFEISHRGRALCAQAFTVERVADA